MSLGLAIADGKRICLAIDRKGINCPQGKPPIPSKLISLQTAPEIKMLVTGGLDHWREVLRKFTPKATLDDARDEIIKLLEEVTECCNEACALILGCKAGTPICYRVNKLEHQSLDNRTGKIAQSLVDPQPIGMFASEAVCEINRLIANKVCKEQAVKMAIEYCINLGSNAGYLEGPVDIFVMTC